jgi:hypothetical protein
LQAGFLMGCGKTRPKGTQKGRHTFVTTLFAVSLNWLGGGLVDYVVTVPHSDEIAP